MERQQIDNICRQVYARFPEVNGVKPSISEYSGTSTLLIFSTKVKAADGKTMPRNVRVVVGPDGKIAKMTTSR
jgi:hypothetical protein